MGEIAYLNHGEVYSDIKEFISGLETSNTKTRYWSSIRNFFDWKYKLELEHLKPEHLIELDYQDMKKYKNHMRQSKKYSFNTINNVMSILVSLFKELSKIQNNKYQLSPDSLRLKRSKVLDEESAGDIDWCESTEWIEYFLNKGQKNKAYLIHIARITGIRKSGLISLTYKDVRQENGYWVINHTLKGKKHKTAITDKDYGLLLELKETDDPKELVFGMKNSKTADRVIEEIRSHFDVLPERNVVFHSLRRLSGQHLYDQTKDIYLVKEHLGHSNVNTSLGYIQRKLDIENSPSLYIGEEINTEEVAKLDKEQMLEVFDSMSQSAKYEFLNKMKELGMDK